MFRVVASSFSRRGRWGEKTVVDNGVPCLCPFDGCSCLCCQVHVYVVLCIFYVGVGRRAKRRKSKLVTNLLFIFWRGKGV